MKPCSECALPTWSRVGICTRSTCLAAYDKAKGALYRAEHPDWSAASQRRRYAKNPERSRGIRYAWRAAHPEKVKAIHRAAYEKKATWLKSLKVGKSCVDCGFECTEETYQAFDWDHRPGEVKLFAISQALRNCHDREEVLAEVAKCDLRCRNCHAIVTHKRRELAK